MPALRLPSTAGTCPHFDVKAADDGHPYDVLLILRLRAIEDDRALTVLTARRQRYMDFLIHPAGNRSRCPLSIGRTGLASRRLWVSLGIPFGIWRGTSLVGT